MEHVAATGIAAHRLNGNVAEGWENELRVNEDLRWMWFRMLFAQGAILLQVMGCWGPAPWAASKAQWNWECTGTKRSLVLSNQLCLRPCFKPSSCSRLSCSRINLRQMSCNPEAEVGLGPKERSIHTMLPCPKEILEVEDQHLWLGWALLRWCFDKANFALTEVLGS